MQVREYAIYTMDAQFVSCLTWVEQHDLVYEIHMNRTRFHIIEGPLLTEFLLRWGHCAELITVRDLVD
jgi:hypothetical protein